MSNRVACPKCGYENSIHRTTCKNCRGAVETNAVKEEVLFVSKIVMFPLVVLIVYVALVWLTLSTYGTSRGFDVGPNAMLLIALIIYPAIAAATAALVVTRKNAVNIVAFLVASSVIYFFLLDLPRFVKSDIDVMDFYLFYNPAIAAVVAAFIVYGLNAWRKRNSN